MSSSNLSCPRCFAALRSSRSLPENKKVRCPQCGTSFKTPSAVGANLPEEARLIAYEPSLEPMPAEASDSRWGVVALFASMFILGGMAVAGVYLAQPNSPSAVADSPTKPSAGKTDESKPASARRSEERRQLEDERRQLEREKKRLAFDKLMGKAEEALKNKRFADAENSFKEALKLIADDPDAQNGLKVAQASRRATEETAARVQQEKKQRDEEIARCLERGKAAMKKNDFAAAVQAYAEAKRLAPDDASIGKALEAARATAAGDAAEKKKLADYQQHLEDGRAAMVAERYDDAVRAFQAALNVLPGDAAAARDLQIAQKRLSDDVDTAKKREKYNELLQEAQKALDAKRPDQAVPYLKQAVKLYPDDKETRRLLKKATLDSATAQNEYRRLMALGDAAMTRQSPDEAKRYYAQAAETLPGDEQATTKAKIAASASTDLAAKRQQFDVLMLQAAAASRQLQYAEAITVYNQALQLIPNEVRATQLLAQAKYSQALTLGRIALAQNRIRDAINLFEEALLLMPNDPAATALLAQARLRTR
jgi:tetratricopeptide (TPR) repeat protein